MPCWRAFHSAIAARPWLAVRQLPLPERTLPRVERGSAGFKPPTRASGKARRNAGCAPALRSSAQVYGVWLTAPAALTMPAPQPPEQAPGNGRAVFFSSVSTAAGVSGRLATDCTSATTPATCGAAIEVPL
ncbi:hypothetical protein CKU38_00995 [Xanthomonas citri pv. fuscans]|nr:hypothetical protein CKU38_00995 [Xanthomonas citri pv. fuscans]